MQNPSPKARLKFLLGLVLILVLLGFDSGEEPELKVGGAFDTPGGIPASQLARWGGSAWSAFEATETGSDGNILTVGGTGGVSTLWVGGEFKKLGGVLSNNVGRFVCSRLFADGFESGNFSQWALTRP